MATSVAAFLKLHKEHFEKIVNDGKEKVFLNSSYLSSIPHPLHYLLFIPFLNLSIISLILLSLIPPLDSLHIK